MDKISIEVQVHYKKLCDYYFLVNILIKIISFLNLDIVSYHYNYEHYKNMATVSFKNT